MATNSSARRRADRDAAGYTTGRPLRDPRCDSCLHVQPVPGSVRQTRYDRLCGLFGAAVKSHGGCPRHQAQVAAKPVEIVVKYGNGAHQTNTVQRQRASSTASYEDAARGLCRKLFPTATVDLVKVRSASALEVYHATVRQA